jgi:hypothetical protein
MVLLGLIASAAAAQTKTFNITDHGATPDGKTSNTAAIQQTIDACAKSGGGTVTIPKGEFVTGTILLKDNVTLHLEDGATLLGTLDLKEYKNVDPFKDGLGAEVGYAMVAAVDAKNVSIEGNGTINGRGKEIATATPFKGEGWGHRPFLVRIVRCQNVRLHDVTLRDAGSWTTNFYQSQDVDVARVTIDSHVAPHNDGFDIDSCQRVTLKDCDVDSGDDALCLKSTGNLPCRDITATNMKLKSRQGAIKLGTESYGGFEHVKITNCQIRDTRNGGIKILCVDGGTLQNIEISDITMDNVKTPIFARLGARLKTFREGDAKKPVGVHRNVTIRNVKANAAADAQIMPPSGIFLTGIPDHPIENFTLENIEIHLAGGGTAENARADVEEKVDTYPEINRFGKTLPAYGIYARHVKGLTLKDVVLTLDAPDLRPALVCQDVQDLTLARWSLPAHPDAESTLRFEDTQNATLSDVSLKGETSTFLRVEGANSSHITLPATIPGATKMSETAAGAPSSAINAK